MSRSDVDTFKVYLLTKDPRFHPATMQKQAAIEHDHQVRRWKQKLSTDYTAVPAKQMPPLKQRTPAKQNPLDQRQPTPVAQQPTLLGELAKAKDRPPTHNLGQQKVAGEGATVPLVRRQPEARASSFDYLQRWKRWLNEKINPAPLNPSRVQAVPSKAPVLQDSGFSTGTPYSNKDIGLIKRNVRRTLSGAGALQKGGSEKEARGGHPANIAFARMLRPGLFPGMDENRGLKVSVNGDFDNPIGQFLQGRMDPSTQEYLYGQEKLADVHGKDGPCNIVESTQDEDIEQDGEALGIAIKKQKIETEPKMEGNEKTAAAACPGSGRRAHDGRRLGIGQGKGPIGRRQAKVQKDEDKEEDEKEKEASGKRTWWFEHLNR